MADLETNTVFDISALQKRGRRGRSDLTLEEKQMILEIFQEIRRDKSDVSVNDTVEIVASSTGVSCTSVFKVLREYKKTKTVAAPKAKLGRRKCIDTIYDCDKNSIRCIVHSFFFKNELPNIDKVLTLVNSDRNLPSFTKRRFDNLLKDLNFKYINYGRGYMLTDKEEIILWRRQYLRNIRKYRQEGRKIYYLGETKICTNDTAYCVSSNSSDKGVTVCHIGSEDGFVEEALWIIESEACQNIATELKSASFEQWFTKVLPYLEDNSVIVMDSALYHSRKKENVPTAASKKSDIQQWLTKKRITFDDTLLKPELLEIVQAHRYKYNNYVCNDIAKQHRKIVLRIPPNHCVLNPIELIWIEMKNNVAEYKRTGWERMLRNIGEAISSVTEEKWQESIQYVQNTIEPRLWQLDVLIEQQMEPIDISDTTDNVFKL